MAAIEFTQNYQDLSTDMGFQFKFHCDRCGDGYLSTFRSNAVGVVGGLLRGASSLFGGALGRAGQTAYEVQRAVGGAQHDAALKQAVEEIKPLFNKCRRCGTWVCGKVCWNASKDMCKKCTPSAEEEETSIRAEHVRTQVANDLFLEENVRMSAKGHEVAGKCPECGAATLGKKFCPECGHKLAPEISHCPKCGVKLTPKAKFCGDCGTHIEG
jgi:hypothetical protein